jgi:hypothetical protein
MSANSELRSRAAKKAWHTMHSAWYRAHHSEKVSKRELVLWCQRNDWKVMFFEGKTGAPRSGIVDAIIARIRRGEPDGIDIRFVQLKSGASGLNASDMARLERAVANLSCKGLLAGFDGQTMHFLPEIADTKRTANKSVQRTGASRSAEDADRVSSAAGSRR